MIAQDDGGIEDILKPFALQPSDFALTSQLVRNFAPSPHLRLGLAISH